MEIRASVAGHPNNNEHSGAQIEEAIDQALQYHRAGRLRQAEIIYRNILRRQPRHPDASHLLGFIAYQTGQYAAAAALIGRAIEQAPRNADFHNHLGLVLTALGNRAEAMHRYRQALELNPDFPEAHNNLGIALRAVGQLSAALEHYRRATECRPGFADAWNNLGNLHRDRGEFDPALQAYREALRIQPDFAAAHSNMLFLLSHHLLPDPADLLAEHRAWDKRHGTTGRRRAIAHPRREDPGKRLRIGYVSPDFRRHAVSYFFEPLLKAHDRRNMDVICYAEVTRPDDVTERLKRAADAWHFTAGLSDAALVEQIRRDGIDILVDLAGHTTGNRLRVFTWHPAPVQVTWLGYGATTGLAAMDYWLTDSEIHPDGTMEQAVETIVRLPGCWTCYQPPAEAPSVELPAREHVVFGCFNDRSKITPDTVALWSHILAQIPGSQLLMKARQYADGAVRQSLIDAFAGHGIAGERLQFAPATPLADYLAAYHRIDIALDPFPRAGGVTTCDTLWMGVPVITLRGKRFIERHSASLLTAAGMGEWIAATPEDYLAKAVALAGDESRRRALRREQRGRVAASLLCDAARHAQAVEQVYRDMWRTYLNGSGD